MNVGVVSLVKTEIPCQECDQETAAAARAIKQDNLDQQALATAKVVGANAQATLNSVNATLNAAQTQKENDANIIAAQIAATAELARANAKATLVAAGSTQNAALTQDSIEQTLVQYNQQIAADLATEDSAVMLTQQYYSYRIANQNATETQFAAETLQSYAVEAN
jgi:ribosomal protein S9